jgi:hypothetical protein
MGLTDAKIRYTSKVFATQTIQPLKGDALREV